MARNPEIVTIDPDLGSRAETKRAAQLAHFSVIGEAGYGVEAVTVAKEHTPDVFLISFEEPVALALQTIAALADAVPNAPTIVYSSLADAGSVRRAMIAGARDYIIKPLKPEDLSRAVYGVLEQEERKRMRDAGETSEAAARGTIITVFGAKGGIGKTTISTNLATELANLILLVTSMDIASIKDTALALEMLRAASVSEDKVKLTINHSTAANSLREEDVSRVLEYEVFWQIPHDLAVSSSTQLGQPIVI